MKMPTELERTIETLACELRKREDDAALNGYEPVPIRTIEVTCRTRDRYREEYRITVAVTPELVKLAQAHGREAKI